ncbi:hypothetical protein [Rhodococcus sp. NPDC127528]|uniref:hypothetical protein n=1 Tax=unclassified Rhodococcus (in: high G+C Gram-positive bacteria) TaxID=192944 RepID=UPI003630B32A
MGYLFDVIGFPELSRMTDLWDNAWTDPPTGHEIATGHFVRLGAAQHVSVEADFLASHLPFHVGGFGGVFPDHAPWVVLLQKAPADAAMRLLARADPFQVLRDSLDRALGFNREASVIDELLWSHDDLIGVYAEELAGYEDEKVSADAVAGWPVVDLLRGLLADCSSTPLTDIVLGYPGCAYPDSRHPCEANVFRDVYAQWSRRTHPDG